MVSRRPPTRVSPGKPNKPRPPVSHQAQKRTPSAGLAAAGHGVKYARTAQNKSSSSDVPAGQKLHNGSSSRPSASISGSSASDFIGESDSAGYTGALTTVADQP